MNGKSTRMVNHMITSMTGFSSHRSSNEGYSWGWEMRGVNAKGLDVRLRVPDWIEGLEQALKGQVSKAVGRGSVTLNLRVQRLLGEDRQVLKEDRLQEVLASIGVIEAAAEKAGVALAPTSGAEILNTRGVMDTAEIVEDIEALAKELLADFAPVLSAFNDMRRAEGQALYAVMIRQIDEIEKLCAKAAEAVEARREKTAETLKANLARVLEAVEADPDRIAQELALLAVKADVTEELDRLAAHIAAARDLLAGAGPVGRKMDFLMQEFNREANTLCSKSGSAELTRIGLDLKVVIDQMREQVQNVE